MLASRGAGGLAGRRSRVSAHFVDVWLLSECEGGSQCLEGIGGERIRILGRPRRGLALNLVEDVL